MFFNFLHCFEISLLRNFAFFSTTIFVAHLKIFLQTLLRVLFLMVWLFWKYSTDNSTKKLLFLKRFVKNSSFFCEIVHKSVQKPMVIFKTWLFLNVYIISRWFKCFYNLWKTHTWFFRVVFETQSEFFLFFRLGVKLRFSKLQNSKK